MGAFTGAKRDPLPNYRFRVTGERVSGSGSFDGCFSKIDGFDLELNSEDYRCGTDSVWARKVPLRPSGSNLTFTRGLSENFSMAQWFVDCAGGVLEANGQAEAPQGQADPDYRAVLTITVMDRGGQPARTYKPQECVCLKYSLGELNAIDDGILVEEAEVGHSGWDPLGRG